MIDYNEDDDENDTLLELGSESKGDTFEKEFNDLMASSRSDII